MLHHRWWILMEAEQACFLKAQVSTVAGHNQTEIFRMYLWLNRLVQFHLHSRYQHLHQDCQQGHRLLRQDMEARKAFCLQVSSPRSRRYSHRRQGLRHLLGLVHQLDSVDLQAKALHLGCLQASKLRLMGEPGRQDIVQEPGIEFNVQEVKVGT